MGDIIQFTSKHRTSCVWKVKLQQPFSACSICAFFLVSSYSPKDRPVSHKTLQLFFYHDKLTCGCPWLSSVHLLPAHRINTNSMQRITENEWPVFYIRPRLRDTFKSVDAEHLFQGHETCVPAPSIRGLDAPLSLLETPSAPEPQIWASSPPPSIF